MTIEAIRRKALRRRLFLLAVVVTVIVAIRRPDWRAAAWRAAEPLVERAAVPFDRHVAAPIRERVAAVRQRLPWSETARGRWDEGTRERGNEAPPPETERNDAPAGRRETGTQRRNASPPRSLLPSFPRSLLPSPPRPLAVSIPATGNLPPRLPPLRTDPPLPAGLRGLRASLGRRPSAAGYRRLADAAAAAGFAEVAAEAYLAEARIYRRLGDVNAALAEEMKAGRYRAEGRIYLHAPGPPPASIHSAARLEPPYGAYLGAFIDRDDQLSTTFLDENWQTHRDPAEFEEHVGKEHASYFCYLRYGQRFPFRWAARLRERGAIPHIAWEPGSLEEVNDDERLARFVDAVARFNAPIFIRFAGEMNGVWTPYHGNPALYREKFRLVHRALSRRAPRAALIWCVNHIPDSTIDAYYPGDDAVDWVGVNFYNVLYFDNDPSRPADRVHPNDMLARVYARYAGRKPIAICEYAASHQASIDPRPRPDLAAARLSQLYAALPRLYPRVKLIDWFDCNNLRHARPDRQLNNYALTDEPRILDAYREAVAPDHFLGRRDDAPRAHVRPLGDGEPLHDVVTLSAWVRAPIDRPRVYLLADNRVLHAGDEPGPYLCRWDTRRAYPGVHTLRLLVTDGTGRRILDVRRRVRVTL